MKKIFLTRKLLKENEEKLSSLFRIVTNKNDKLYSSEQIIKGSYDCDGILSSVSDKFDKDVIYNLRIGFYPSRKKLLIRADCRPFLEAFALQYCATQILLFSQKLNLDKKS